MDGRRSHPQKKPRVEYNATPLENHAGKEFEDLNHQQVDDPLLRQRAKQACDKCRAKNAPEEISSYPVTNAKDPVECAISPNRRFHSKTAPCHCGIRITLMDSIDFRDFEAADEARSVLEWALEELYLRVRPYNVDGLPEEVASLIPWLKATSQRPLPVYFGSSSRSAKKRPKVRREPISLSSRRQDGSRTKQISPANVLKPSSQLSSPDSGLIGMGAEDHMGGVFEPSLDIFNNTAIMAMPSPVMYDDTLHPGAFHDFAGRSSFNNIGLSYGLYGNTIASMQDGGANEQGHFALQPDGPLFSPFQDPSQYDMDVIANQFQEDSADI